MQNRNHFPAGVLRWSLVFPLHGTFGMVQNSSPWSISKKSRAPHLTVRNNTGAIYVFGIDRNLNCQTVCPVRPVAALGNFAAVLRTCMYFCWWRDPDDELFRVTINPGRIWWCLKRISFASCPSLVLCLADRLVLCTSTEVRTF